MGSMGPKTALSFGENVSPFPQWRSFLRREGPDFALSGPMPSLARMQLKIFFPPFLSAICFAFAAAANPAPSVSASCTGFFASVTEPKLTPSPPFVYFAMGVRESLPGFVQAASERLQHDVVSFNSFATPVRDLAAYDAYMELNRESSAQSLFFVPHLIRALSRRFPGQRIFLFNLTSFDLDRFDRFRRGQGSAHQNLTNIEMEMLLNNRILFDQVRWFQEGEELTREQAVALFRRSLAFPDRIESLSRVPAPTARVRR